ncbi:energy transducer TonB [Nitrospira defluvii]|nr:energy transducer TonB [Nitrospira defluvii]
MMFSLTSRHLRLALFIALGLHGGFIALFPLSLPGPLEPELLPSLRLSLLVPVEKALAISEPSSLPLPKPSLPMKSQPKPVLKKPLPKTRPPEPKPELKSASLPLPLPEPMLETIPIERRHKPLAEPKPIPPLSLQEPIQEIEILQKSGLVEEIEPVLETVLSEPSPHSTGSDVSRLNEEAEAAIVAYEQQLVAWLEQHKRYPRQAKRLGIVGEGLLRIRIDRAGQTQFVALERGTGHRLLDRAALDMVHRANPFPSIPKNDSREEIEFIVPLAFILR